VSTGLSLESIDRDSALAEAVDRLPATSRQAFLRGALGAALGASAIAAVVASSAAAAVRSDVAILNFALTLEYLQAAFYTEAERMGALTGAVAHQAQVVGAHERAHVRALQQALGHHAVARPGFDFRGATETQPAFVKTAVAFEDLGVAAYKGQAPHIRSDAYLAAALAIHSVEARHAAWIRRLAGVLPAEDAFDEPRSRAAVNDIVRSTHFVQLRTGAHSAPGFTG
jgi:hypothetical protein